MQYLKFTYVDAVTAAPVTETPAVNGPAFPAVEGLQFEWARESQYPTDVPEFFGTCPDDATTQLDGVLGVYTQQDYDTMRADELRARNPVPQSVSRAQGKAALISQGLWSAVTGFVAAIPDDTERALAEVALNDTQEWRRDSAFLGQAAQALGLEDAALDALFIAAAQVQL